MEMNSCINLVKSNKLDNDKRISGMLSIIPVSDTHFVIKFQPTKLKSEELYDLEDLTFGYSNNILHIQIKIFNKPNVLFEIIDENDMMLLQELVQECRAICDITLRIQSIIRDVYFAEIMKVSTNFDDNNNINLLLHFQEKNDLNSAPETLNLSPENLNRNGKTSISSEVSIQCSYCQIESRDFADREFMIHPYVQADFDSKPIYLCIICANNWKDYRDKAESENLLKLEGEYNEDICSFCSDFPPEIILCSSCPRSYCETCIKRMLSPEKYNDLKKNNDWFCMACVSGTTKKCLNPMPRNAWKTFFHKDIDNLIMQGKFIIDSKASLVDISPKSSRTPCNRSNKYPNSNCKSFSNKNKTKLIEVQSLPPINNEVDEVYYYQQYILYYSNLCKLCNTFPTKTKSNSINKNYINTDDACFLCKDGGELIECDWVISGKLDSRCRKVYHEYCLSYSVDDNIEWFCPRHFCDICGSLNIKYLCLYCPISICSKCPEELVKMYGHANYIELDIPNTGEITKKGVVPIACQSCLKMLDRCIRRGNSPAHQIIERMLNQPVKTFPGQFLNKLIHSTGIFKKWDGNKYLQSENESKDLDIEMDLLNSNLAFLNPSTANEVNSNENKFLCNGNDGYSSSIITFSSNRSELSNNADIDNSINFGDDLSDEGNNSTVLNSSDVISSITSPNELSLSDTLKRRKFSDFKECLVVNNDFGEMDYGNVDNVGCDDYVHINNDKIFISTELSNSLLFSPERNDKVNSDSLSLDKNNYFIGNVNAISQEIQEKSDCVNYTPSKLDKEGKDITESTNPEKIFKRGRFHTEEIIALESAYKIHGNNVTAILNDGKYSEKFKCRLESSLSAKLSDFENCYNSNYNSTDRFQDIKIENLFEKSQEKITGNSISKDRVDQTDVKRTITKKDKKSKSLTEDSNIHIDTAEKQKVRRSSRVYNNIIKEQQTILDAISSQNDRANTADEEIEN